MSYQEDQVDLTQLVGATVVEVDVKGSFRDDFTSVVTLRLSNGKVVSFSSQGFCDGSSCLTVDVDS